MSSQRERAFPVGFEVDLILDRVKSGDRVVYLNSCACLPLYQQLLTVVGEANIRTTGRVHEFIGVEDDWASLVVGQCVLDEFHDLSEGASEISRVLSRGGTALLSGPVSRNQKLKFDRHGKPPQVFFPLREVETALLQHGLRLSQTHKLTEQIKIELSRSERVSSLDFDSSMDYVLIGATKITGS